MRKSYLFVLFCFSSVLINAQTYVAAPTKQKQANLSYNLAYDTVKTLDVSQFYNLRYSLQNVNGPTYTLFYNKDADRMFDLCKGGEMSNCSKIKPAFIDSIYRNEDERISAVYLHTPDSLFAITDKFIYGFNSAGKMFVKIDFAGTLKKQFPGYDIYFSQKEKPFYYYAPSNSFFISVAGSHVTKGVKQALKKGVPLFLKFSLADAKWERVNVTYSEIFRKNDYGLATEYYTSFTGDAILYNFQSEPNIYKYMPATNTVEVIGGASSYADSIPKGFKKRKQDRDFMFNWFVRIPKYDSPVMYDPFKNFYYRVFYKGIPVKNSAGLYNTQWDKGAVVMVFDRDFNVVKEIEFAPGLLSRGKPFVSEKGLHLDLRTKSPDQPKVYAIIDVK